ncbi:MAG: hypothetical protein WD872_21645 [Pirellulaceae bacterium]
MGLAFFYELFPEQSEVETLAISLDDEQAAVYKLPASQYFFCEQICPNPDCRCNEVIATVCAPNFTGNLASLIIGFEDTDKAPTVKPALDAPQSQYSDRLARLLFDRLKRDPPAAARLQRHYDLVKKRAIRDLARHKFLTSAK